MTKLITQKHTTHGLTSHKLYQRWNGIIRRTTDIRNKGYKDYGGRGIKVCDRWLKIENFIADMYPSYKEGLSIDRIDNNKGYSKNNCRWANRTTQSRNTRLISSANTSGYRGVYLHKSSNKWLARISINGKSISLGYFSTAIDGAKAYDQYVIMNHLEHTINGIFYR